MSNDLQPAPASGPVDPLDVLEGNREKHAPTALGDRLWHFFISMRTGLGLMLGLGVLTLIGTLVKQASAGIVESSAAYQTWLDSVRADYGGWTERDGRPGLLPHVDVVAVQDPDGPADHVHPGLLDQPGP